MTGETRQKNERAPPAPNPRMLYHSGVPPTINNAKRPEKTFNAAFLTSQEKERKRKEIEAARESVADGLRLAKDAEESLRLEKKKIMEGRKASQELKESRRAQVAVREG